MSRFQVPSPVPVRSPIERPEVRQSIQAVADATSAEYYRLKMTKPWRQRITLGLTAVGAPLDSVWVPPTTLFTPESIGVAVYSSTGDAAKLLVWPPDGSVGDPDNVLVNPALYAYTRLPVSFPDGLNIGLYGVKLTTTVSFDLFLFPTVD